MAAAGDDFKLFGLLTDTLVDQLGAFLNTLTFAAHQP